MGCTVCYVPERTGKILFLGLPDSGKTTALYQYKLHTDVSTIPTHGFNSEIINIARSREVWDIGGTVEDRNDILYCVQNVGAVAFFIDCSKDDKSIQLALKKLELMLSEKDLKNCPVAIVANKQDKKVLVSVEVITEMLKGKEYMKAHIWKVFPCSGKTGDGLHLMLKWLDYYFGSHFVQKKKHKRRRRQHQRVASN